MSVELTPILCYAPVAFLIGFIIVFGIYYIIQGVTEEPVIIRGKIVDMDVNAHAHTTKESSTAHTNVTYVVRFVSDEGKVYQLSTSKSLFLRVRPGDYGDAHIKTIFRQLIEFEPSQTI